MGIRFYGKTLAQWRLGLKNIFDKFLIFSKADNVNMACRVPYEDIRHKVLWETLAFGTAVV